ncbi:MAG: hypothetical protein QOG17_1163, partial [Gammaproteobacteria bacterium]|nr:hypothetical protein [Gammaproteobacteria bacterium]
MSVLYFCLWHFRDMSGRSDNVLCSGWTGSGW